MPPHQPIQPESSYTHLPPPPAEGPVATPVAYAGFWLRAAAILIDALVITALNLVIIFLLPLSDPLKGWLVTLWGLGYMIFMVGKYQATLGKMAVGLRIERTTGEKIGFGRAALREVIGKTASQLTLCIGFLMIVWTKKKQGLHDKIADTVVVEKDPGKPKSVWIGVGVAGAFALPILIIAAAIILSSLNAARTKANDATIKAELSTVRVQAELFYGENGYSTAESCLEGMFASDGITPSIVMLAEESKSAPVCEANKVNYMVAAQLSDDSWWCVDSHGTSAAFELLTPIGSYACTEENSVISGSARENFVSENAAGCVSSYYEDRKGKKVASRASVETYCSCSIEFIADIVTNAELAALSNGAPLTDIQNQRVAEASVACGGVPEG